MKSSSSARRGRITRPNRSPGRHQHAGAATSPANARRRRAPRQYPAAYTDSSSSSACNVDDSVAAGRARTAVRDSCARNAGLLR